jgi:secreted trypsin-like serine protease
MKFFLLIFLFSLFFVSKLFSQLTEITVVRSIDGKKLEWSINDISGKTIIDGRYFNEEDTLIFSLYKDQRFFINLSVPDLTTNDSVLFILSQNNQPLFIALRNTEPGDYSYSFFTGVDQYTLKITGGADASIEDFPWQVYLRAGNYYCGGTIIGDKWVITAAHCVLDENDLPTPVSDVYVRVGATRIYFPYEGKLYRVKDIKVHEGYNPNTFVNDIAVIELEDSINFENAKKIDMLSPEDALSGMEDPGVMAWLTGWGITDVETRNHPNILQKAELPIVSNATAVKEWPDTSNSILMAGYKDGFMDSCSGDSGGPLVVPAGDGFKLAGIVSWGGALCNNYSAYTRVSAYDNWIKENTGIGDNYKPEKPLGESIVCQGNDSSVYTTSAIPEVKEYEWKLNPVSAGSIFANESAAIIKWSENFNGSVKLSVRTRVNDTISSWSSKEIVLAPQTKLINQSVNVDACEGEKISLKVGVQGYLLAYNWYRDSHLYQSGNSNEISFSSALASSSGRYIVEISGSCGDTISKEIELKVYAQTKIVSPLKSKTVSYGDYTQIEAEVEGNNWYSWEKNGELLNNSESSLLFENVKASDIGMYRLTAEGTCGTITDSAYLFVNLEKNIKTNARFSIWPSITDDLLYVANKGDELYDIYAYNSRGKLLFIKRHFRYNESLSLSGFDRGLIILRIKGSGFNEYHRIIKN